MYYSDEDGEYAQNLIEMDPADPQNLEKIKFTKKQIFYEGFVKLHDEGYSRSLYVNSYIPYDNDKRKFFYINTKGEESWILLLVKAMAKYMGSYDNLSQASLQQLSNILFGSQPTNIHNPEFDKIYSKKFDIYGLRSKTLSATEAMLLSIYDDVNKGVKSGKFILMAQRMEYVRSEL